MSMVKPKSRLRLPFDEVTLLKGLTPFTAHADELPVPAVDQICQIMGISKPTLYKYIGAAKSSIVDAR